MSPTLVALVAFATWTGFLVFALANLRLVHTLRTKKAMNSYSPQGDDLEGLIPRWTRAHLNCLEFLPILGAVTLSAVATGNTAITDPLAMVVFYCRVAQSVTHIVSTAQPMILVRGAFFVAQLLITLWWAIQLLRG